MERERETNFFFTGTNLWNRSDNKYFWLCWVKIILLNFVVKAAR